MHAVSGQDGAMPGLLSRLFARPPELAARVETLEATLYSGDETLEVVGESHYPDALWRIFGGQNPDPVRLETNAGLVPEPVHPHHPHPIPAPGDCRPCAHLPSAD